MDLSNLSFIEIGVVQLDSNKLIARLPYFIPTDSVPQIKEALMDKFNLDKETHQEQSKIFLSASPLLDFIRSRQLDTQSLLNGL